MSVNKMVKHDEEEEEKVIYSYIKKSTLNDIPVQLHFKVMDGYNEAITYFEYKEKIYAFKLQNGDDDGGYDFLDLCKEFFHYTERDKTMFGVYNTSTKLYTGTSKQKLNVILQMLQGVMATVNDILSYYKEGGYVYAMWYLEDIDDCGYNITITREACRGILNATFPDGYYDEFKVIQFE